MKRLIPLLLLLSSCATPDWPVQPTPTAQRDWTRWQRPEAGTRCMLRIFHLPHYFFGSQSNHVTDVYGSWGDGQPWLVRFDLRRVIPRVVRIEVWHVGVVVASRNFRPPATLTPDRPVGWRR